MGRIIFHIDVNSAFLSWTAAERLKKGEELDLRTIPSAIGGSRENRHGIILAKSTPAKKYGVTTGEPINMALQKCPELMVVPPDFPLYSRCSHAMFDILSDYSDRIEQFSIDEGFLDYTGMERLLGPPLETAEKIRTRIREELGFTVNIGISSNKLLAKMAGELEKPDKLITLFPEEMPEKFWPLPVEELFMVGRRTAPRLRKIGIRTIGELAKYPQPLLEKEFKSFGRMLHAYANGIDDTPVAPATETYETKSIGNSTTTPHDVTDRETAHKILLALAENVSMRLRCSKLCAQEIAVTLKSSDFKVYSHQKQLLNAIDCTNAVYETAKEIFDEVWKQEPLRLLGIRAGKLCEEDCVQLSILEEDWSKQKKADAAMDALRLKYGKNTVRRSTFANGDGSAYEGGKLKINNHILK
ncbi:MAG: DNA polymerase IV [Bacteroidales bacterium]|nr:DNA polymerase IV [Anaerotignum sp.]MCI5679757.1 DNA polymerase IV [Bacteroidales bacterium]MDY3927301.1 DNA polymerase IV [Anaerotignum sp.]